MQRPTPPWFFDQWVPQQKNSKLNCSTIHAFLRKFYKNEIINNNPFYKYYFIKKFSKCVLHCFFSTQNFRLNFNPLLQVKGGIIEANFWSKTCGQFIHLQNIFYTQPMKNDFFIRYSLVMWKEPEFLKMEKIEKSVKSTRRSHF